MRPPKVYTRIIVMTRYIGKILGRVAADPSRRILKIKKDGRGSLVVFCWCN